MPERRPPPAARAVIRRRLDSRVAAALRAVDAATLRAARALERAYPPGTFLEYEYRGKVRTGVVRHHDEREPRFLVANVDTGREYWVSARRITSS